MSNILGTKANIVTMALQIGGTDAYGAYTAEQEHLEGYFDEAVVELAKASFSPLANANMIRALDGTAVYTFPTGAERIISLFHAAVPLSRTDVKQLEVLDQEWRDLEGTPYAWSTDRLEGRTFQVYPTPDTDGAAVTPPISWGATWPTNDLTVLYSESRTTDIADWIAFYLVFGILMREFSRLSDHQDLGYSALCGQIAQLFGSMAGLTLPKKE